MFTYRMTRVAWNLNMSEYYFENIYNQYGQLLVPKGRNYLSPKEALFYVRTRKRFDSEGNNLGSAGDSYRKELHELIRQHYLYTGSKLARTMLDDWNHYVEDFIQVVPIEYKRVLQEEQVKKLQQKIADMQRDY